MAEQADEIRELKKELERSRGEGADQTPRLRPSSSLALSAQAQQAAPSTGGRKIKPPPGQTTTKWGIFDMLGIGGVGAQTSIMNAAANGMPATPGGSVPRRSVSTAKTPGGPGSQDAMPALKVAVNDIEKHFAQAQAPGTTKTPDVLGNDQQNKDIAVLVRQGKGCWE